MPLNQIPIKTAVRKNTNTKSAGYGKYYVEVMNNEPISTRALLDHIMKHGLGVPRSIVSAVLIQVAECLTEFMQQGQPVKLDGFGTFKFSAINAEGWSEQDLKDGKFNVRAKLKGIRLVVIPDNSELDKLTSTSNLEKVTLQNQGVISTGQKYAIPFKEKWPEEPEP